MEIVKKLNLNKSPQQVDNNSLICAKNIKISSDGQYITNDDGIKEIFRLTNDSSKIVGVISCNIELVIFTHNVNGISTIYRYNENSNSSAIVPTGWKWNGGSIIGDYTYNIDNDLIISFCENTNDNNTNQLKFINLDKSTDDDSDVNYNISPIIPKCTVNTKSFVKGNSIPCGLYYIFIRYELQKGEYTKWFSIGVPVTIGDIKDEVIVNHVLDRKSDTDRSNVMRINMLVNNDSISSRSFILNFNFDNITSYKRFQLGYVLCSDDKLICREWQHFDITSNIEIMFGTKNSKEYDINTMLSNTYSLSNVKNIKAYNNRLYIAGYDENKVNVNDTYLQSLADNVNVTYTIKGEEENGDGGSEGGEIKKTQIRATTTVPAIDSKIIYLSKLEIAREDYIFYKSFIEVYNEMFNIVLNPIDTYFKDDTGVFRKTIYCVSGVRGNSTGSNITGVNYDLAPVYVPKLDTGVGGSSPLIGIFDNKLYNSRGNVITTVDYMFRLIGDNFKYYPNSNEEVIKPSEINRNELLSMNIKTLIPNSIYNFFIHYVRNDGSFTNGFQLQNKASDSFTIDMLSMTAKGDDVFNNINVPDGSIFKKDDLKFHRVCDVFNNANDTHKTFGYFTNNKGIRLFKAPSINKKGNYIIGLKADNIELPDNYIGAFLSYETPTNNVLYQGLVVRYDNKTGYEDVYASDIFLKNSDYTGIIGKTVYKITRNGTVETITNGSERYGLISATNAKLSDFYGQSISIRFDEGIVTDNSQIGNVIEVQSISKYIYSSTTKNLISLGFTKYANSGVVVSYSDEYNLFNYDGIVQEDSFIQYTKEVSISDDGSVKVNNTPVYDEYVRLTSFKKYSNIYINLRYISTSSKKVVRVNQDGNSVTNIILYPRDEPDLFKYKPNKYNQEVIQLSNYDSENKDKSTNFKKTIRRSDTISDESPINSWRNFQPDAYKVISENKGSITNIVGVGLYLLIHTEHSLFMFNRDASLKTNDKDVQLTIPDAFDTDYQEVFTSNKGYGGLQDSNAWCVNEYGYTFFDNDAKKLYNFDNGQLNILSLEINELINSMTISKTTLAYDNKNNRLLITFRLKKWNINDGDGDVGDGDGGVIDPTARMSTFDNIDIYSYITISYNYLTKSWISLHDYTFDKAFNTKRNIYFLDKESKKSIYTLDRDNICNFGDLSIEKPIIFPRYKSDYKDIYYSYVDIIFNQSYETIKSLISIEYILGELLDYEGVVNQAEQSVNSKYSGYRLILYTDQTNSGTIDIDVNNLRNSFNNYKFPYFDKGKWNLNYFRNYVESIKSDNRSYIYGKYIVARFVFNNDTNKRIKLENINFNVDKY